MMLASPLYPAPPPFSPQHTSEDSLQYRPSRDLEAFNNLLPPPIEFIEGSSSGALAIPEGKYQPINTTPKALKVDHLGLAKPPPLTPVKSTNTAPPPSNAKSASLFLGAIDSTWPLTCNIGNGLYNSGNTCFLNSALQCLLHTPPLLRVLLSHGRNECRVKNGFCMTCNLRQVTVQSHGTKTAFSPYLVTNKLQTIAKHMRKGRQEDSHEFLRYAIDALQKSCLAGHPPKIDPQLAETTWVHKIFGGQLRSRVTCRDCGHNSDTFDSILDLSLDIYNVNGLKEALRKFVAIDYLKGADRYKCEKCKKHVIAEKRFTLHRTPLVLTVHLKRFSPLGRKIGHHVNYDDHLSLQPYMSKGQHGPSYSLYGVICHAGGGPNSGHYFAYVKSREERWWEMNDESVSPIRGPPVGIKNAYILFYLKNKGQGLDAAIHPTTQRTLSEREGGLVAGMKKRKVREADDGETEDKGIKVTKPFIGPRLPSPSLSGSSDAKRQKPNPSDPQADLVKKKIEATAKSAQLALTSVESYASDNDQELEKEDVKERPAMPVDESPKRSSPPPVPPSSSPTSIPAPSFYSSSGSADDRKRKPPEFHKADKDLVRERIPESRNSSNQMIYKPQPRPSLNPFSRVLSIHRGQHKYSTRGRPRVL